MKIPIGIFFGGATPAREHSFQTAQEVFKQLGLNNFDPIAIFIDPFGQLIFLEDGMPSGKSIDTFYPSENYFTPEWRMQFGVYPEQFGKLGANERKAMAKETGKLLKPAKLPELISIAFLALPDVQHIQEHLQDLRIPHTGESAALTKTLTDRFAFRKQLQDLAYPLPAALRLGTNDWKENSLQAIWGPDSVNVNYPLLIRPSHQYATGRSTVVTAKDGPEGLRRAIDLAFGQRRLSFEDWLDMNPVDRENLVRHLAQWSSGIGFPLSLQLGEETKVFQKTGFPIGLSKRIADHAGKPAIDF